jgi:hypothetical protein
LRKGVLLFFAKEKKLKPRKIKSIQRGKEVNKTLRRYIVEHLRKRFIEEVERLPKVLAIPKATKGK